MINALAQEKGDHISGASTPMRTIEIEPMHTYIITYRTPQNEETEEKIEGCSAGNAFAKCLKLHPDATLVKAQRQGTTLFYGHTEWTPPPVQRAPVKEPRATRPPKPNEKVCEFSFYDEAKVYKAMKPKIEDDVVPSKKNLGHETPLASYQTREETGHAQERQTILSGDRVYRYVLWREWDMLNPKYLMVVGLNPSTADETTDDPTIRKCIGFAKRWGLGALCMTNLFAYRATDPRKMKTAANPEGEDNDRWLRKCASGAEKILAAWGKHGRHRAASSHFLTVLDLAERSRIECLRLNNDGSPQHPLYVPYETLPCAYPHSTRSNWNLTV